MLCVRNFRRFVRNFGRVFAIRFEILLIEIEEEIHHFAGWGGFKGRENCEQTFCEQTGFWTRKRPSAPSFWCP